MRIKNDHSYNWATEILREEFPGIEVVAHEFDFGAGYGVVLDAGIGENRFRLPIILRQDEGWNGRPFFDLNAIQNPKEYLMNTVAVVKEEHGERLAS